MRFLPDFRTVFGCARSLERRALSRHVEPGSDRQPSLESLHGVLRFELAVNPDDNTKNLG